MHTKSSFAAALLGIGGFVLVAAVVMAASGMTETQGAPAGSSSPKAAPPAASSATKTAVRKSAPPLPAVGFAPVRPMDVVRATYDFAAQHPEVLKFVPCFCGCGTEGHSSNESCFIARRDARGNVLEWDTHGFGCTICVDVAKEAMQLYSSGADVQSIRAAIERKWTPGHPGTKTPTPYPPKK